MSVYIYGNGSDSSDTVSLVLVGTKEFRVNDTRNISTKKIQNGSIISDHVSKNPFEITISFNVGDSVVPSYIDTGLPMSQRKSWLSTQVAGVAIDIGRKTIRKTANRVLTPEVVTDIRNGYVVSNGIYDMVVEQFEYFNYLDDVSEDSQVELYSNEISEYTKTMRELIGKIEDVNRKNYLYKIHSRRLGTYENMILKSISISELRNSIGGFECTMTFSAVYISSVQKSSEISSSSANSPTGKATSSTQSGASQVDVDKKLKENEALIEQASGR